MIKLVKIGDSRFFLKSRYKWVLWGNWSKVASNSNFSCLLLLVMIHYLLGEVWLCNNIRMYLDLGMSWPPDLCIQMMYLCFLIIRKQSALSDIPLLWTIFKLYILYTCINHILLVQRNFILIQDETLTSMVIQPDLLSFCFPIKFQP